MCGKKGGISMNLITIERFDISRILYKELYSKIISSISSCNQITNYILELCINKLPTDTCYIVIKKENEKTLGFNELPYNGNLKICYASMNDDKIKYVKEMMIYALHNNKRT